MSFLSRWKPAALPVLALTLPLLSGCTAEPARTPPAPEARQERAADSLKMARVYEQWRQTHAGTQMPLDLGDADQYAFLVKRLEAAGNTRANSPRLFSSLAQQRERVLAQRASGSVQAQQTPTPEWCGHTLPLEEIAHGTSTTTFVGSGYITCHGGSDYSYVDFNAYSTTPERQEFQLLSTTSTEAYLAKTLETDPMDVVLDAGPDRVLFYDSVAMAYDEASGRMETYYSTADTTVLLLPTGLNFEHPRELIGGNLAGNAIRTCLERGSATGALDCDYALARKDAAGNIIPFSSGYTGVAAVNGPSSVAARRWTPDTAAYWNFPGTFSSAKLYLPAQGNYITGIQTGCTVQSVTGDVSIILLSAGGRCKVGNVTAPPGSIVATGSLPWGVRTDSSNIPFNGLMDLGPDCLAHEQDVAMQTFATVNATCPRVGGGFSPIKRVAFKRITVLDFKNSCLAAGTRVLRADGKAVPVESVQVGDKVLSHVGGRALTVTTVTKGTESQPMVRLKARGQDVLVTSTHPMLSPTRGVVAAGALEKGDTLSTKDGQVVLAAVERVPYAGQVYNLTLGTDEELKGVGDQEHTLIANGFVVGDARMQTDLERKKLKPAPANVLAALPAAWHADYQHEQARKAARR